MAEKIEISEEHGKLLFGDTVEQTTETVDEITETVEEETQEQEESTEVVESEEEEFVTSVVTKKDIVEEQEEIVEEKKQPEATTKTKPKAKVTYRDEYHAALNKYISENETYSVEEFNRKYNGLPSGISDLEIVKAKFFSDPANDGIPQRTLAKMFDIELEKYQGLDSDDPDERQIAEGRLKREANMYLMQLESEKVAFREAYKADTEQEIEFDGEFDQPEVVQEKTEAELQAEREALSKHYKSLIDPIIGDGFLTLKDKEGEVKIPISNPDSIIEAAIDPVKFLQSLILDKDGNVSLERFVEVVAFANDKNLYNSTLIKYSKGLGTKNIVAEIKNTAPIVGNKPNGQIDENSSNFLEQLLKGSTKKVV